MNEPTYYVRIRGAVSGPFGLAQLQTMRRQGQLARFHEMSTDGASWAPAATIAALFPAPASQSTRRAWRKPVSDQARPAGATAQRPVEHALAPEGWFFSRGDQPVGPIALDDLRRRAGRGEVNLESLVWVEGMPTWLPYRDVVGAAPASAGAVHLEPSHASGPRRVSGMAVVSLVLGLTGWPCGVGSLLALIFGVVALGRIARSEGQLEGRSLAIAGLVLGAAGVVAFVTAVVFFMINGP